MSTELLINVTPSESRVALIENGVLQEIQLERIGNLGIVGNIYLGKISRVLPGMQAAFVDIGLEKAAFLHASDIVNSASIVEGVDDVPIKKVQDIRELFVKVNTLWCKWLKIHLALKVQDLPLILRYLLVI